MLALQFRTTGAQGSWTFRIVVIHGANGNFHCHWCDCVPVAFIFPHSFSDTEVGFCCPALIMLLKDKRKSEQQ